MKLRFTLIELLVVITIIAVLAAMLLPALSRSRAKSKTAVCQGHLKQLAYGIVMYTNDWDGKIYPYDNLRGLRFETFWMTLLEEYKGYDDLVRVCPSAPVDTDAAVWGTADKAWGNPARVATSSFIGDQVGSYAFNSYMHDGHTRPVAVPQRYFRALHNVEHPSVSPVFGDASWVDGWPKSGDPGPASGARMGSQPAESSMGRFCVDRHSWAVNLAFADGSVSLYRLPELWSELEWHRGYRPTVAPVILP
jgi:prepilin-type N-terminal cleavage/methylation domain-containing protein/prepilin-type processing-associated H-X9-DG protein